MLKVLIVEDEPPILRGIKKKLERFENDIQVIASAYDGQEALDLLIDLNQEVNVIFTDINMPGMNGVRLTAELARLYPHITVIVLSGYEDFNYARTTFQNGIFDYLLKPLDPEHLEPLVKTLSAKIRSDKKQIERQHLNERLNNKRHQRSLAFSYDQWQIIHVCAGPFPICDEKAHLPGQMVWDKISLEQRLKSYIDHPESYVLEGVNEAEQWIIINCEEDMATKIVPLFHNLKRMSLLNITMLISPLFRDINDFYAWHIKLREASYRNLLVYESQLLPFHPHLLHRRTNDSSGDSYKSVKDCLDSFEGAVKNKELKQINIEETLCWELRKLSYHGLLPAQIREYEHQIKSAISLCFSIDELKAELSTIGQTVLDRLQIPKVAKDEDLVPQIIHFLEENFTQKITNNTLSEHFALVPSYVSSLFKSKMQQSPLDYLLHIRLQHAKDLMAQNPGLRTQEIANNVGFPDPLYFSRVFKKSEGMSPSEYKKQQIK